MNLRLIHLLSSLGESDKELLNEIQWTFPLVTRPFDAIAKKFDTTPEIIKEKLTNLKEIGVLRQLSAIFDTRKLGYTSSLVAMEIKDDKLPIILINGKKVSELLLTYINKSGKKLTEIVKEQDEWAKDNLGTLHYDSILI